MTSNPTTVAAINRMLTQAYAGSKAEPPAAGLTQAASDIESAVCTATEKFGALHAAVYSSIVACALTGVSKGYGPVVIHFALVKDVADTMPAGERPVDVCKALVGAGLVIETFVNTKRGRSIAWVPKALSRERKATSKDATASPTMSLANALLAAIAAPAATEPKTLTSTLAEALAAKTEEPAK